MERRPLRVGQVVLERVRQQVQLEAEAEERPVLVHKIGKQWLTVADVRHVLHGEHVQILRVDVHVPLFLLRLGLFLLTLFLAVLLLGSLFLLGIFRLLLGQRSCLALGVRVVDPVLQLPQHGLPLAVLLLPRAEDLLPLGPLALEPLGRLQLLHALGELPLQHPLLHVLFALGLWLPRVLDVVEALVGLWKGELGVGQGQGLRLEVGRVLLPEGELLLILRQLDHNLLLLLLFLLLLLLSLLFLLFLLLLICLGLGLCSCGLRRLLLLFRLLRRLVRELLRFERLVFVDGRAPVLHGLVESLLLGEEPR
mmetsp:Transcript_4809/g.12681  ORF Transcript_4809/g.12681 Transcript_4809/m.12681 type:complete len:309 (+) Transcript_4809:706-1632(+)